MMARTWNSYRIREGAASRSSARRASRSLREGWAPHTCEPVVCRSVAANLNSEPTPIWLAALIASRCQATANGEDHAVLWNHVSGRALYTNSGSATETIEPLGVSLQKGQTLAVSWTPGETAYTLEVYRQFELCA